MACKWYIIVVSPWVLKDSEVGAPLGKHRIYLQVVRYSGALVCLSASRARVRKQQTNPNYLASWKWFPTTLYTTPTRFRVEKLNKREPKGWGVAGKAMILNVV